MRNFFLILKIRFQEKFDLSSRLMLFILYAAMFAAAKKLIEDAKGAEAAGAVAVVLECVPAKLAELISKQINIPTIGIAAGAGCDGQVLVYQDMLAMFGDFKPKFVKQFGQIGEQMKAAFSQYIKEVQNGVFPAEQHTYGISDEMLEKLY